jgi:gamma-glutamyltranspeptidase/glutathione hydrolase
VSAFARPGGHREDYAFATATRAMVSTSHPLATSAALDMLRRGGSAADAYVAAAAVQVVVEPPMTTFGGVLQMTWFDSLAGKSTLVAGGFGRPAAETGDWDEAGADSGRTIAAPGWLVGAREGWRRFGRLRWAELFEHALAHAREGFTIDPQLWGWVFEYRLKAARFPEGQRLWYPNGHLLNVGDVLVQPDLARTIAMIQSDEDLDTFYRGEFAERYVATARADGGRITLEDMARQRDSGIAVEAEPIGRYRGYDIHAPGANLIALALGAVEHGDLRALGPAAENPETLYLQMRLVEEIWHEGLAPKGMGSADLWSRVAGRPSNPYDAWNPGTNALVVFDGDGNVASGTHSCSSAPFGNGHIIDGVWLSRPMIVWGQPTPAPRGISTSLLLAKDGKAALAVGSPSISCVHNILQNTINVIEFGMSARASASQPLFGAPWHPSRRAMIEGAFSERHFAHLTARGMGFRRVSPDECEMGSCQMVTAGPRGLDGVADMRRRGQAAGF